MIHLVLSLDYEIFGNGAGDVHRDMVEPTYRLMRVCSKHGAKVSIMFEVAEYWAIKEAEEAGQLGLGYSPSREIEEQVRRAVTEGHDAQLHLHPWWIGATFVEGRWQLRPEFVRISDLPNGIGSADDLLSTVGALSRGKRTLEHLIRPVCPDYVCLAYRAGAFCGQPSKELISGLKRAGLIADSSVIRGLYETSPVPTDYRKAESAVGYWWTRADDIGRAGVQGEHVLELPVSSVMRPYIYNFKWMKLYVSLRRWAVERKNVHGHGMMHARSSSRPIGRILRELATVYPFKYDFCKLSANDMIRRLCRLIRDDQRRGNAVVGTPVVMVGHSKDFWNEQHLEKFLQYVNQRCEGNVCFRTLGDLTRLILQRDLPSGRQRAEQHPMEQRSA